MTTIREGLDRLVASAGAEPNGIGKILVPNIAESRLRWGKWERHRPTAAVSRRVVWLGPERLPGFALRRDAGPRYCARFRWRRVARVYLTGLKRGASTQKKVTILRTP